MAEHLPGPTRPTGLKAHIVWMVTDPRARGRGLARLILDELLAWSAQHGADVADLNATAAGHGLYRAAGFEDSPFTAMTRRIERRDALGHAADVSDDARPAYRLSHPGVPGGHPCLVPRCHGVRASWPQPLLRRGDLLHGLGPAGGHVLQPEQDGTEKRGR